MEATGNQLIAVNATGCLEVFSTPYPETSWQIPWIHSLFGNAAAVASGVAAAQRALGPHRRARHRAGRRRRHDRHRLRLPVRHVRAQRRRALHLLRQRGVHEHRRAALERDAAGGAYRHDPGSGTLSGQCLRHRQERAAHRDGAPHSLRRDRERFQSARPRAQGQVRDGDSRRALHSHLRALPARLGLGVRRHDQARAPGRRDRPLPAVRSAATA